MKVPFLDLGAATRELRSQIGAAGQRVIDSGWYVGGPELEAFEQDYAAYCQVDHCVGVGNGLDALTLALRAMDVGPGDEVIVASNGYIATLLAVSMTGATPVPVDPDPATHNLDPTRVEAAISPRTRVILPTHLYGQPADLDALLAIARAHELRLLEDGAQAHGASYKGRRVGAHGDAVTWSFYPSKNLGALGDGGAVTTNDAALAKRIRTLGNYGSATRYVNDERGVNSRLDPLHAAVLRAKLPHLDEWNNRRRGIAGRYLAAFTGMGIGLPQVPEWAGPAWHLFVVTLTDRDAVQARLRAAGVETLIHYPIPPHRQKAYAHLGLPAGSFPIAEQLASQVLSLPIGPQMSDAQAEWVIAAVREAV
ncbi:DegT/DnrJ/EryC1/StrS family aminotransferase [Sphingomonas sp. RB1R13]|uniref:DegT/DnrJ/EryC1/StrS family aminotransferase n=1 Tax=Sphingomonas sp. RB1R13 TaxID=3096159 RepID=UPI002FCC290C